MIFNLLNEKENERLGVLKLNNCTINTPACLQMTKAGTIPFLSKDALIKSSMIPPILLVSLDHFIEHEKLLEKYSDDLSHFIGMKDSLIFLSMHDPSSNLTHGFNDLEGVALWGRGGKVKVSVEKYVKMVKMLKPQLFEALSDVDTKEGCSKKRLSKSSTRSLFYLDKCLQSLDEEPKVSSNLFAPLLGGFEVEERLRYAREVATRPSVAGFVVDGVISYGKVEEGKEKKIAKLIKPIWFSLPSCKPRIIHGSFSPLQVLHLYDAGIDLFDNSYPHLVTEAGGAMVFDWDFESEEIGQGDFIKSSEKAKELYMEGNIIFLKNNKFCQDMRPLQSNCQCIVCSQPQSSVDSGGSSLVFSRAYVSHLLNTNELLAYILLSIHNNHNYTRFFSKLREASKCECLYNLKRKLSLKITPPLPFFSDTKQTWKNKSTVESLN